MVDWSTRDVATRGARMRFVEAGSGPGLLLLHDALASHLMFEQALARLAQRYRVIAPDLPGFGASEKPDPEKYAYGWDAFAESAADLVAALGLGRVHVLGHGVGGGVALTLAATHPAVVHRLVLVDALVYGLGDAHGRRGHGLERAGRLPVLGGVLWRQLMGRGLFRACVRGTVYAGAQRIPAGRVDALYEAFNGPAGRQAAHATLLATADTRPLVAKLPRVSADALVVWGRDDSVAPVDHGRRLARELRARFEVLECGRCPPDEEPDAFAATVLAFLDSSRELAASA